MNRALTFRMAKEMDKDKLAAARIRMRFLDEQVTFFLQHGSDVATYWAIEALEEICYLIKYSHNTFSSSNPKYQTIEQHHIDQANEYPIENLIPFVNGKAYAFCHEDKSPSLTHWKAKNKARCFVCNKTFGPISVLMERDNMKFLDAVRSLI